MSEAEKVILYIRSCPKPSVSILDKVAKDMKCSRSEAFEQIMSFVKGTKFQKEVKITVKE